MAYYNTIKLVAGDDLPQLDITLRNRSVAATGQTLDVTNSATWATLDLTTATTIQMKFRKVDTTTLLATLTGTKVSPYTGGNVTMDFGLTDLDSLNGDYEGEISIVYNDGKVLTDPTLALFDIRAGF